MIPSSIGWRAAVISVACQYPRCRLRDFIVDREVADMSEQGSTATEQETAVTVERRGHVLLMGLNRPEKRNAFNLTMIDQLAAAYHQLEADDELRCGVLF